MLGAKKFYTFTKKKAFGVYIVRENADVNDQQRAGAEFGILAGGTAGLLVGGFAAKVATTAVAAAGAATGGVAIGVFGGIVGAAALFTATLLAWDAGTHIELHGCPRVSFLVGGGELIKSTEGLYPSMKFDFPVFATMSQSTLKSEDASQAAAAHPIVNPQGTLTQYDINVNALHACWNTLTNSNWGKTHDDRSWEKMHQDKVGFGSEYRDEITRTQSGAIRGNKPVELDTKTGGYRECLMSEYLCGPNNYPMLHTVGATARLAGSVMTAAGMSGYRDKCISSKFWDDR